MSFDIIDRRGAAPDKDKSSGSRQKFFQRNKKALKEAIDRVIGDADGFTDIIGGEQNKRKKFSIKGTEEPTFGHGEGGEQEHVISGNDRFSVGDMIDKPMGGQGGGGSDPSEDGEGEDDFVFYLDRKEFLDLLFEDLELPEMVKQSLLNQNNVERERRGLVSDGPPMQLDLVRTFKNSLGRRISLNRKPLKEELAALEEEREALTAKWGESLTTGVFPFTKKEEEAWQEYQDATARLGAIDTRILEIRKKLKSIPFLDPLDLRYRNYEDEPKPSTCAAMFCIMDVSGSMTEQHKTIAKLFFFLLYMFLQKNYDKVAIVFIRHTHVANEVDEKEFFYSKESGGTHILPALQLVHDIIRERFELSQWNIYAAQASDGDSFGGDAEDCRVFLADKLLPMLQYMVYIQIDPDRGELISKHGVPASDPHNALWKSYQQLDAEHANFEMKAVGNKKDIYPVFRKLFEKKGS